MFATIVGLIQAFLQALPIINRWFTKTPTEKVEEEKTDLREETENFKETGRPTW